MVPARGRALGHWRTHAHTKHASTTARAIVARLSRRRPWEDTARTPWSCGVHPPRAKNPRHTPPRNPRGAAPPRKLSAKPPIPPRAASPLLGAHRGGQPVGAHPGEDGAHEGVEPGVGELLGGSSQVERLQEEVGAHAEHG
eukprot:CAMPEP_0206025434 /NCGR_PEP_ID=MMETSP1464-20131121/40025_1 /ASSEMBLY_ACC=CAM_ASM_001124 /TAXON_ID=119497 /ORGANISM="Exanthemachrysis gayraliae, Strain RCC1523" /LENGTH=140 /DNA_ID=CAMNT_0053399469 /DNA_START=234 /DNA_END=653 /DNA_ORIENTATION=-